MKVLLVITGMSMGGAEKVVANLADALAKAGHEILIAYLKAKPFQVAPQRPDVRVVCLDINSIRDIPSGYLRFRKIVREFKPHIVHSHMFHATMLARLARLTMSIPSMISTCHNAVDGGRLRALAYRATDRLTDISTNVSREAVEAFVDRGAVRESRMVPIYNGIAVDEFRASPDARARVRALFGIGPGCKLYLAAGRLSILKDYPNMFAALARLPKDLDFKLLIAGDGALRPTLEKKVTELGLDARVRFLGIRSDITELMSAADVFVLSSSGEGFALVVAEAMACECVVVATDCGGVKEVLGSEGFLVPSRDPQALADALVAASSLGEEDAAELGKAARRRVVNLYSFDRAVERWQAFYGELVDRTSHHLDKSRAPS
jgi:glycosyltransferase involved in cell wall biosynthesis